MKKTTDILFSVLIFLALLLPSLYFLGVKENFVRLYGAERVPKPVPLTVKTYKTKSFQKTFDEIFGKNFFLRNSFSRCRNQIFNFCNFGYFFASGTVFKNWDGWFLGASYLTCYYSREQVNEKKYRKCFELMGKLAKEFKKKDIDFIYILATDKVFMYPERLPFFYSYYLARMPKPYPYGPYGEILKKYQVPYFDSYAFLHPRKNEELFPMSGIHWNSRAASLTFAEALRKVNKDKKESEKYIVPVPVRYEKTTQTVYAENDAGRLANLIWGPENVGLHPVFSNPKKNMCNVIVMGDSFSEQISQAIRDSRSFSRVINYSNRTPASSEDFYKRLDGTKLFVLVYVTWKLENPLERHGDLQKVYDMLRRYPGPKPLPFGKTILFNSLDDYMLDGFSGREPKGRWASGQCALKLPVPADLKQSVLLTFNGGPLSPDQKAIIKNSRNQVLKTVSLPVRGSYQVAIPPENISRDHYITLNLEFPQARKPGNPRDNRILSFMFQDLKLELSPEK